MLKQSLSIFSDMPIIISLGLQTLLSELSVMIKGIKVLLYNVWVFTIVG